MYWQQYIYCYWRFVCIMSFLFGVIAASYDTTTPPTPPPPPPPPTCTPVCSSPTVTYGEWSGYSPCVDNTQSRTRTVTTTHKSLRIILQLIIQLILQSLKTKHVVQQLHGIAEQIRVQHLLLVVTKLVESHAFLGQFVQQLHTLAHHRFLVNE